MGPWTGRTSSLQIIPLHRRRILQLLEPIWCLHLAQSLHFSSLHVLFTLLENLRCLNLTKPLGLDTFLWYLLGSLLFRGGQGPLGSTLVFLGPFDIQLQLLSWRDLVRILAFYKPFRFYKLLQLDRQNFLKARRQRRLLVLFLNEPCNRRLARSFPVLQCCYCFSYHLHLQNNRTIS